MATEFTIANSDAQYARSEAGRKKLAANLQSDIDKAYNALVGKNIDTLVAAIKKEWAGEDATKFIQNIKDKANQAADECNKYKAKVQSS